MGRPEAGLWMTHQSFERGAKVAVAVAKRKQPGLAKLIVANLRQRGQKAILVTDGDSEGMNVDLLILFGNCRSFHHYARILRTRPANRPRVAIWQLDPLPPPELDPALEKDALNLARATTHWPWLKPIENLAGRRVHLAIAERGLGPYSDPSSGNFIDAPMVRMAMEAYAFIRQALDEGWVDHLFMSTVGKERFLASRGIKSEFAPMGYYPDIGGDRGLRRDIDVLFLGKTTRSTRRRQQLEAIVPALEGIGAHVEVVDEGYYGEARIALLNRVKIVLHLHKYPWDTPWMRFVAAAANGAAVVSEPLTDPEPFEAGVQYIEAPFNRLPATIAGLLKDNEALAALTAACQHFVKDRLSLRSSLDTILSTSLASESASPVKSAP